MQVNEMPPHTLQDGWYQKKKKNGEREQEITSVDEDVEKLEPLGIAGRNLKW